MPGCPETYQTDLRRSQSSGNFRDQHQKIRQFREGDLLVVPAGVSHWMYNRGQSDLILIVFVDTRNVANQIDPFARVSWGKKKKRTTTTECNYLITDLNKNL